MKSKGDKYIKLARETVEDYILEGKRKKEPENLDPDMKNRAGVFVSIKKDNRLRGCIGTIKPTQKNIAQEIISNAISASAHDPRFSPIRSDELEELEFSVDILGEPEEVDSIEELDPHKYGVIVEGRDHCKGLLLPDLEGIDTAEEQVEIARKKAGLPTTVDVRLYRFEVIRYK